MNREQVLEIVNDCVIKYMAYYDKDKVIEEANTLIDYLEKQICINCVYKKDDICENKYCPMYLNNTTDNFGCNRFGKKEK